MIQVIHNLIQNAQDAVGEDPQAKITLMLEALQTPAGAQRIRFAVLDSGPGIAPEARARLFEPYFTSKAKGSGLGLAIVKKIVEENQGRVNLTNRVDLWPSHPSGAVATVEFAKLENASDNQTVRSKPQEPGNAHG